MEHESVSAAQALAAIILEEFHLLKLVRRGIEGVHTSAVTVRTDEGLVLQNVFLVIFLLLCVLPVS
jgi:hypothetical protein